ncbi:MAG: hypothetical protein KBG33_08225 [Paludibacteraceae bacterium]|jgi:high-affinity Fe2+/Pb2+ permease|nr:hypothetical protein [Paludibacteraceae bacterium]
MPEFEKITEVRESLKQYLITNFEIIKLQATERASVIGSVLASKLVVGLTVFLFVFTLSIGLGFYLSALLGDTYSGFAIIAGFYFLLVIVLLIGRKKLIENPLRDKIIKKILESKMP